LIGDIGPAENSDAPGLSAELVEARKVMSVFSQQFDDVLYVIGNHEGRLLRALQSPVFPSEILRLLECEKWRIAPMYFANLISGGEEYSIEHPKGCSPQTARNLAAKLQKHVIMGHSHILDYGWDISGSFYAIQSGHCCDEARLPYAAQRHNTSKAHELGAVIVREGYPYLLHRKTKWKHMVKA
jgi:hypothetical protein